MSDPRAIACETIQKILSGQNRLTVAIEGCCASGKSTLAAALASALHADVIPMDDFFLPACLRTQARLKEPGGNVHYERFLTEVAAPLFSARSTGDKGDWPVITWRKFDCSRMDFAKAPRSTAGSPVLIIEGAYCLRPEFVPLYDLKLFLDVSPEIQKQRIIKRNGESAYPVFRDKWIPLENRYFEAYHPSAHCLVLDAAAL